MPKLRPYQSEDVAAVLAAHQQHQCVIGRAATGLGKAVELAALADHYSKAGRVMVLVDVTKLVRQLADTIAWYTGMPPGIEMGEERAADGQGFFGAISDRIVVSTVQTQYSGGEGNERFRKFDPAEFSAVLLDECELFLAPKAKSVVAWYQSNPQVRIFGCTATPFRSDGTAMAELFNHVAFDRDILWGINEGWLVKARQAFVRVSLDFSTLKLRKDNEGEEDWSEAELAEKINNEATLIELAKGIITVAQDRKSIVVCPDVASANAVTHYLCAEKPGCARCIYGELGDTDREELFNGHSKGNFQFLCSVMMLTKGYDDPSIRAVFNCRKTKSRRLYQQILGRGTRPLKGILEDCTDAEARRAAIAASGKPDMLMVNLVGIEERVRDMTVFDILGTARPEVIDRAKTIARDEQLDMEEAMRQAEAEVEEEQAAERAAAEAEQERLENEDEQRHRRLRERVLVQANVEVEYQDDLGSAGASVESGAGLPQRQLNILRKAKLTETEINRLSPDQAKDLCQNIVYRWKAGLCSYKQAKLLQKAGYTKEEIKPMTREQASEAIEQLKANGWHKPAVTGAPQ